MSQLARRIEQKFVSFLFRRSKWNAVLRAHPIIRKSSLWRLLFQQKLPTDHLQSGANPNLSDVVTCGLLLSGSDERVGNTNESAQR